MYIAAKPISCNSYTYEIEVYKYGYPVSNLLMPLILSFGDGTVDEISLDNYSFFDDNNGRAITIYKRVHTFPGAGIYDISLRFFNRSHDIRNMAHSINTPFYIESRIIIDPFLGCNSTPVLENMTYLIKKGTNYMQDFSFTDIENDSLSFCFATPMQDDSIPVIDYQIPMEYELELNNPISRISLDPINGSMFLNAKNLEYTQSAVLQVNEWRKVNGEYYQISRTNLDFVIYYIETDNNTPEISQITDTAIIIGKEFRHLIVATDPDNDSIQLNSYGDLFQFFDIVHNELSGYNPGPLEKSISFSPVSENVRPLPYKAIFSVNDKSLDNNMSMYIWVADKAHIPDPVQYFTARESGPGIIKLDWIDVDDELGYIIERSDKFSQNTSAL